MEEPGNDKANGLVGVKQHIRLSACVRLYRNWTKANILWIMRRQSVDKQHWFFESVWKGERSDPFWVVQNF